MNKTIKIKDSFNVDKYAVLLIDDLLQVRKNKIKIDDDIYEVIPAFDIPNAIAVVSNKSFVGKEAVLV